MYSIRQGENILSIRRPSAVYQFPEFLPHLEKRDALLGNGDLLPGLGVAPLLGPANPDGEAAEPMRVAGLSLNVLDGDEVEKWKVLPLGIANPNTISAAGAFGIDRQWFEKTAHRDPYTGQRVYGIVPVALLTDDSKKYKESIKTSTVVAFPDLALDADWYRQMREDSLLNIHPVAELLMGSGYTVGCNHLDGSPRRKFAKLKLSNGDWLYVAFWEWYNK